MGYRNCKYLIINAFALQGAYVQSYCSRGAATLCPGLCARCPAGRVLSMSGRLCCF